MALFPPVLLSQEGKGGHGGQHSWVCHSPPPLPPPHHLHLQHFRLVWFSNFFDQWRSITCNRFVLNMVLGHHLQLRSHPPLFHDFWHFNVKVAAAHHPVIQMEVDELLAKRANITLLSWCWFSILACLWYLSILGTFIPYSV